MRGPFTPVANIKQPLCLQAWTVMSKGDSIAVGRAATAKSKQRGQPDMKHLRLLTLILAVFGVAGCDVPQPGDPDYERYRQSKADRAEWMFQGAL